MDTDPPPCNKKEKIINHLRMIAEDVPGVRSSRIAAAIVIQGKIKSIGVNSYRTDPLQKRFQKNQNADSIHAEVSAIKNFLKRYPKSELEKATIYIVRRKRQNGLMSNMIDGNACPCVGCASAIRHYNIKNVVYTV